MYSLYLAFRYMSKRVTAYLSVMSFMIGVAVLIIVNSVMYGFAEDMKEKIRGTASHLTVRKGLNKFIPDYQALMEKIEQVKHVEAVSPRITWPVLYTRKGFRGSDQFHFGFLTGIDPNLESRTTNLAEYVEGGEVKFAYRNGRPDLPGLLTGMAPVEGQEPSYFPDPDNHPSGKQMRPVRYKVLSGKMTGEKKNFQQEFEVVGQFSSGMYEFDQRRIYCSLDAAQEFLQMKGYVTELAIRVDDFDNSAVLKQVKNDIYQNHLKDQRGYSPNSIKSWKEQRSSLLQAVKAERGLTTILLSLVIIVSGFMLLAILSMMVLEKQRDIGIIRSLGGTVSGVAGIFLAEGLIIGTIGTALGIGLGYVTVTNLNPIANLIKDLTGWHPFPAKIYFLDQIPYIWSTKTALIIGAVTIVLSFAFSLIPAIRAARKVPIEAIRHE
jgi:lipoprotein-releasing system permease protein